MRVIALWALLLPLVAVAEVLPPDRLDVMYHSYDGGGATIDGPSMLVRKNVADTVSVSAGYYVDMVSSASIDVLATASEYTEERTEYSVGVDYLHDSTLMNLNYSESTESDYRSETVSTGISQTFFGDLTTISMGLSFSSNYVGINGNETFSATAKNYRYQFNISQILTKSLIAVFSFESVIDEGFLNNPYRQVRYKDSSVPRGYSYQSEVYPLTRNSDAFSLRGIYYLPWRASIRGDARYHDDSWGIAARDFEVRYLHSIGSDLLLEAKYRSYSQTQADFYSDLFPYRNAQNFMARDKELSEFSSGNFGVGVTYTMPQRWLSVFEKSTANLYWDHFQFDYDNFRNVLDTDAPVGEEELYAFDANVIRLYLSFWF
ncbi:DUF3570 domain-containing protein [Gilvimarinus agarilyticus]|uniref:DUF3570 domain-containing protein n=1 Tax=Gilvimarinus agarilyticus TaxID=679259 RepID=UPI00059FB510